MPNPLPFVVGFLLIALASCTVMQGGGLIPRHAASPSVSYCEYEMRPNVFGWKPCRELHGKEWEQNV